MTVNGEEDNEGKLRIKQLVDAYNDKMLAVVQEDD